MSDTASRTLPAAPTVDVRHTPPAIALPAGPDNPEYDRLVLTRMDGGYCALCRILADNPARLYGFT